MNISQQPLIDESELSRYETAVEQFSNGDITEDQLMVVRLQQGIYGQRQDGVNMIRIKLPGGRLTPNQLSSIGSVLENYSNEDIASITTRQDIQLHSIKLGDTPSALRELASAGLTTREACGNTVRNISACPLAGVCPREHVDVQPYIDMTTRYFLRHPLTQHMPRKFKMSFSGCEVDCAQGMIHDVAVIAVSKGNQFGFKVLAAGGLGHKPRQAIVVEEFIDEQYLLPTIEAIITVHNRYSDRKRRAKSRIKFLVDKFGAEEFLSKYQIESIRTREAFSHLNVPSKSEWVSGIGSGTYTTGVPRQVITQKQIGYHVYPIAVPLGDLSTTQLKGIAELLANQNLTDVRAIQDQNLLVMGVKENQISKLRSGLSKLGLAEPISGDNVVACPGTWTCRLGITSSRNVAVKLNGGASNISIRVSGCQNGCAQPTVADIGIHGEGKRLHGKLIPHYRMHFGGDGKAGGRIGLKGPEVPAARIARAIERVQVTFKKDKRENELFSQWTARQDLIYFKNLLADLIHVSEADIPSVLKDQGAEKDFKVLQLGGGECAGASVEDVAARFSEAANERQYLRSFLLARNYELAVGCAQAILKLVGQSLLHTLKKNSLIDDLDEITEQIKYNIPEHSYLYEPLIIFTKELDELKDNYDESRFTQILLMLNYWTILAGHYCQENNSMINLLPLLPEVRLDVAQLENIIANTFEIDTRHQKTVKPPTENMTVGG